MTVSKSCRNRGLKIIAMKTALFPGSFDPFTIGHYNIVCRGLLLFERVVVAVGYNCQKKGFLDVHSRVQLIRDVFKDEPRVEVIEYTGLTADLCDRVGVYYLLRGVRSSGDFEYEREIDNVNRLLNPKIENVLLFTHPSYSMVSSSIVRELYLHKGPYRQFMPLGLDLESYL